MTYIYGLQDPNTGRFCYIGKTTKPQQRYWRHRWSGHGGYLSRWIDALRQQGQRPKFVILEALPGYTVPTTMRDEEITWAITFAEEGHPILNQSGMPPHLRYPRGTYPDNEPRYRRTFS